MPPCHNGHYAPAFQLHGDEQFTTRDVHSALCPTIIALLCLLLLLLCYPFVHLFVEQRVNLTETMLMSTRNRRQRLHLRTIRSRWWTHAWMDGRFSTLLALNPTESRPTLAAIINFTDHERPTKHLPDPLYNPIVDGHPRRGGRRHTTSRIL